MVLPYTSQEWIVLAKGKHGDAYDYSLVDYKNQYTEVELICPLEGHGIFSVVPKDHLSKKMRGCPICKPPPRKINTEIFINDAREIHGDKYDYSKVEYKNRNEKVEIICKEKGHGSFFRNYRSHVEKKQGCNLCKVTERANSHSDNTPKNKPKKVSPRYNPEYHGEVDYSNRTKEQRRAYREYRLAIKSAIEDPENTLNKCRKIAEIYCYSLQYDLHGDNVDKHQDLDTAIKQCKRKGLIGGITEKELKLLQDWGNYGSHARQGHKGKYPTYERIKPAIIAAEAILDDWFDDFVKLEPPTKD